MENETLVKKFTPDITAYGKGYRFGYKRAATKRAKEIEQLKRERDYRRAKAHERV